MKRPQMMLKDMTEPQLAQWQTDVCVLVDGLMPLDAKGFLVITVGDQGVAQYGGSIRRDGAIGVLRELADRLEQNQTVERLLNGDPNAPRPQGVINATGKPIATTETIINNDWRLGIMVKPKMGSHPYYGVSGRIIEVLPPTPDAPDGHIKVQFKSGKLLTEPADDWVTA